MYDYLAKYASIPGQERGRQHKEASPVTRSCYQRDRDRIIHCSSFRRLKHKTQVFVYHEGDYYRTRLTHSIEVAQIARSIARAMQLNEELAEALALSHDFGHTAFGHSGEDALDEVMQPFGGFDHNAQSLRLVTKLERRYADFDGLNLTWDTLEGIAKHNGPLVDGAIDPKNAPKHLPWALREFLAEYDLEIHTFASAEAQVAAVSDDIAYNNHDVEDGLRAGLFTLEELSSHCPLVTSVLDEINQKHRNLDQQVLIHEMVRRLINRMVNDILISTSLKIQRLKPQSVNDVRLAGEALVTFSDDMMVDVKKMKDFLMSRMYKHHRIIRMMNKGKRVVKELFNLYIEEPRCLPKDWYESTDGAHTKKTARTVADFIAGMTDRYALRQYKKQFDVTAIDI